MSGKRFKGPSGEVVTSNGSPEGDALVDRYEQICREQGVALVQWIDRVRGMGCKAAHPDDGWVDRDKNTVALVYPHFDDGLQPRDLLALGSPDKFRVVLVTEFKPFKLQVPGVIRGRWHFIMEAVDVCKSSS